MSESIGMRSCPYIGLNRQDLSIQHECRTSFQPSALNFVVSSREQYALLVTFEASLLYFVQRPNPEMQRCQATQQQSPTFKVQLEFGEAIALTGKLQLATNHTSDATQKRRLHF